MPQLEQLTAEVEATTDEMVAACEAFKAEVLARRGMHRTATECSKAEWTLLKKLDRLWAKRRSALREQRELLQAAESAGSASSQPQREAEAVA